MDATVLRNKKKKKTNSSHVVIHVLSACAALLLSVCVCRVQNMLCVGMALVRVHPPSLCHCSSSCGTKVETESKWRTSQCGGD